DWSSVVCSSDLPARVDAPVDPMRGLSDAEVKARQAQGMVNVVTDDTRRSVLDIVRANIFTRFNAILGGLLAVVLATGEYRDALFGIVLVSNALIGIVQELRAKRTLDRLSLVSVPRVRAVRDGALVEIHPEHVVQDDIVEIQSGAQVPVDGVVVVANELELDESLLTGESDPINAVIGSRALSGSFVVAGHGRFQA